MIIHKIEVYVYDHEGDGGITASQDVIDSLKNNRYYSVMIGAHKSTEIENWTDDHPTNRPGWLEYVRNLFKNVG